MRKRNGEECYCAGCKKLREAQRRFALVRMELIGEPTITPDGQSIQLARFPWQRPTDASHGISLDDIFVLEPVLSDAKSHNADIGMSEDNSTYASVCTCETKS